MAEGQPGWVEPQSAENPQESPHEQAPASKAPDPGREQVAEQHIQQHAAHQLPQHHLQQSVPPSLQLQLQALQGHPGFSPADIAAIQQHNALILQAQQAQQDYESEQREKGQAMQQMGPPEALAMHPLGQPLGQPGIEPPQLQHQHDADYERERKEKRKVANREAARRMRQRRAAQVSTLSVSNDDLKAENGALQQQLAHLANHNRELMTENAALRQEILNLKQTLENNRAMSHAANGSGQPPAGSPAS